MKPTKLPFLFGFVLSVVACAAARTSPSDNTCTFGYSSFPNSSNDVPHLSFSGDGKLSHGAVEVSINKQSWGWVVDSRQLQFKPSTSRVESSSFNTTFHMNLQVSSNNSGVGGGVAFMLASHPHEPGNWSSNRTGQWLGLYNGSINGHRSNNIVAVEFDTYKDGFDPNGNHVGLDLNNIRSFRTKPLLDYGINLSANNSNVTVWIDYNGPGKRLDVFMAFSGVNPALNKNAAKKVLSVADINLGNYTSDVVYAGFSASAGDAADPHRLFSWNFSMDCFPTPTDGRIGIVKEINMIVAATAAACLVGMIAITLLMIRRRNQKQEATDSNLTKMELESLHSSGPRTFSYSELSEATGNFSKSNTLGSGASGTVYRATLYDKTVVAVKRISCKGVKEFVSELSTISRLQHRNILPLLGWSFNQKSEDELFLVYQYMPKGSLDRWLFAPTPVEGHISPDILNWAERYKVLCGTASALVYLHEGREQTVIHRDVKVSNIMLDSDFTPRLGDFGLARVTENGVSQLETVNVGSTPGYMPPEMLDTRMATKQADVYSFGIVVLEVVCGRPPIHKEVEQSKFLLEWVWELYEGGKLAEAVDSQLEQGSYDEEGMERILKVGLWCTNPNMMDRPPMSSVLQELTTKGPSTLNLPSSKPKYYRSDLPSSSRHVPPPSGVSKSR